MYHLAIVDNNEMWCSALTRYLQQQGYEVSIFVNVRALLREVAQFDLVLVDFSISMPRHQPNLNGSEIIHQVRHQLDDPPLLVLVFSFLTPDLLKNLEDMCPEADTVLSKYAKPTDLLAQIQQLLVNRTPPKRQRCLHHETEVRSI